MYKKKRWMILIFVLILNVVTIAIANNSPEIMNSGINNISDDTITMKKVTITEEKTIPKERWYDASLCGVIDEMEPAKLDRLSQNKYDNLKNTLPYEKIAFSNDHVLDPNILLPLDKDINDKDKTRFVIKLNKKLDQNTYTFLMCHNVTLLGRSGNSYFAKLNPREITKLSSTPFLRGIWMIPSEWKLGEDLKEVDTSKSYNVTIWLFEDVDCSIAEPILSHYIREEFKTTYLFNELCSDSSHYVIAEIDGSNINKIAEEDIVKKITLDESNLTLKNYNAQLATGSDIITQSYDGSGVRVAVVDGGIAYSGGNYHPDLPTPVWSDEYLTTETNVYDETGHGTHVTGTIMGDGSRNADYEGIAPGAELVVIRLCGEGPFFGWPSGCNDFSVVGNDPIEDAVNHDSNVISISLGEDDSNEEYTGDSEILDEAVGGYYDDSGEDPAFPTIVVAAGNDNDEVTAPATAKNVITVGAAKPGNHNNAYGSWCEEYWWRFWGTCDYTVCSEYLSEPAGDDSCLSNTGPIDPSGGSGSRVKPDVIAPHYLISTYPWYFDGEDNYCAVDGDDYYCLKGGTSMATPVVSGIATSLLHHYSSFEDWPEAIKAMIINSAVKLPTGTVPSSKQGHGHVNAYYSHYNHNDIYETVRWVTGGISEEDPDEEYTFSVPSGFEEIKATLVYTDDPGAETTQDLDLYMYDDEDDYVDGSTSSSDTVEEIKVTSGSSGTWKVVVSPYETDRTTYYSVVISIKSEDPDLDMSISRSTSTITAPNTPFTITTTIENDGYVVVGSYIELDVPSGFTLEDVDIIKDDSSEINLDDSQLYSSGSEYRVSVGETVHNHDREVVWHLKNDAGTENGIYTFNIDYGGINYDEEEDSTQITIDITENDCSDGDDNDDDGYTDCADADCTQGEESESGFCCGSGCSTNGGTCSDASTSGFTCTDGNCNTYSEACQNGELESSLVCSGTSLSCSGGSCEYGFGAPEYCDEITPGGSACENSPGSYDELACELSGTNCYYEGEQSCGAPSGCDEKDENDCSDNSGFQCEWQGTYDDNVVEECDSGCGAISQCDEEDPGYDYTSCTTGGQTYFADQCSSSCQGEDRGDNICRSSAFAAGCTADSECNGVTAGTGDCDSSCNYISACTQNSDCSAGEYCNEAQTCASDLATGYECGDDITYLNTDAENNGACSSGYCRITIDGTDNDKYCAADSNDCVDYDGSIPSASRNSGYEACEAGQDSDWVCNSGSWSGANSCPDASCSNDIEYGDSTCSEGTGCSSQSQTHCSACVSCSGTTCSGYYSSGTEDNTGNNKCETACTQCDGSGNCENIADHNQDTTGSNQCTATCKECDGAGNCANQNEDDDYFSQCGAVECDGDATPSYYYGWSSLTCYYREDESDGACDGSGACKTASDYCPSNPQDGSSGVTCDCDAAEIGCSGTTIGSCDNNQCDTSPTINSISATSPQGFGENVTITANITDVNGTEDIDTVLVGITPPEESETNYTMNYISGNIWKYKFTDFTNGTYSYTVYVNDSEGLTDSDSGTFEMYVNLYINIQTLENNYTNNELVNITDPPEQEIITKAASWDNINHGDGTHTLTLYSGTRNVYEDNKWKRVEDARSLKDKGFDIVYLENDPKYKINVIDFNYTWIKFEVSVADSDELNKNVPVKILKLNESFDGYEFKKQNLKKATFKDRYYIKKFENKQFSDLSSKHVIEYKKKKDDFNLGNLIQFGESSTVIRLQENNTEVLFATYVCKHHPDDTPYDGGEPWNWYYRDKATETYRSYFSINISKIPASSTILNATWSGYLHQSDGSSTGVLYHVYGPKGKDKTSMTWNNQPCGTNWDSSTYCNLTALDNQPDKGTGWYTWRAEHAVRRAYLDGDNNVSLGIKASQETGTELSMYFYSEEYTGDLTLRPYLNITYSPTDNQSKIRNDGTANTSIYLLMKVQYWDGINWTDEAIIQDDTSPRVIQPNEVNQLKLDAIWNPNAWNTSTNSHGTGTYRAYVAATDQNNIVLQNYDSTDILSVYNFILEIPPDTQNPSWKFNRTNFTSIKTNQNGKFNITAEDNLALDTIILSFKNHTSAWENISTQRISGISYDMAFNMTLSTTRHQIQYWKFYINDSSGNWNETDLFQINISDTPPTTPSTPTITGDSFNYTNVTLTSSTGTGSSDSDGDSITYYYQWRDNDDSTVLQEGTSTTFDCGSVSGCDAGDTIYLRTIATTTDANSSYSSSASISINNYHAIWQNDGTNFTTIKTGENGLFNITVTDADGLSGYIFSWTDSGDWVNDSWTTLSGISKNLTTSKTITASEGTVQWRYYVNDSSGVMYNSTIYDFTVLDTTFPSIILNTPSNNSEFPPGTTIDLSITDIALDEAWYSNNNGVTNNSLSSPYDIDTTNYAAGKFDLYVWANDTSGNVNESRFTFTIGSVNITINLPSTVARNATFYVYGHVNLSNGTNVTNNNIYVWVNGSLISSGDGESGTFIDEPIPVIMAGGPRVSDEEILKNIYGAIQAGGSGICVGRNGFNRDNTTAFVKAAREIVHGNKKAEEVIELLK